MTMDDAADGTGAYLASGADADVAGRMLDLFNREFEGFTPGAAALAQRLRRLVDREDVLLVLAGPRSEPTGLALMILRPTAFVDGLAGLLEDMYVVPGPPRRGHRRRPAQRGDRAGPRPGR